MRTSQLQQQLAKLRERPETQDGLGDHGLYSRKEKKDRVTSLLYEAREALTYDVEVLRRRAVESFDTLMSTYDPDLFPFSQLFDPTTLDYSFLRKKRVFLSEKENSILNELVNGFINRIARFWLDTDALQCLEFLIRHHKIQKFNVNALILMGLPCHDTPIFVRLVHLVDLQRAPLFQFLKGVAKAKLPLKRSVFVSNCLRNPQILSHLSEHLIRIATEIVVPNVSLISFFSICCLEIIGHQSFQPTESFVRRFIPCIFFALTNPLQHELHASGLVILASLAKRATLSRATCTAAVTDAFLAILNTIHTGSLRQQALLRSLIFLHVLIAEQFSLIEHGEVGVYILPGTVVQQLVKAQHRDDVLTCLTHMCRDKRLDIAALSGVLFRSFFVEIKQGDHEGSNFKKAVKDFSMDFLNIEAVLFCNVRIAVCLAVFEVFLKGSLSIYDELPELILNSLEKRYPSTTTQALNYVVSRNIKQTMLNTLVNILCETLANNSLAPVQWGSRRRENDGFSLCCALANSSLELRREAVTVGLARFQRAVQDNADALSADVLRKMLLGRSGDSALCIATDVFNCAALWLHSAPSETLCQLFLQIYFLVRRVTGPLPWTLAMQHGNGVFEEETPLTALLLKRIDEDNQVKQRLILVINCITLVFSTHSSPSLKEDVLRQVSPVFLPLCWAMCFQSKMRDLRDALVRCATALCTPHVQLTSGNTHNLSQLLPSHLSHMLLTVDHALHQTLVHNPVLSGSEHGRLLNFSVPLVSVCCLEQSAECCPNVQALPGYFLGGVWHVAAWLEALCYRATNVGKCDVQPAHIPQTLRLCWNLWLVALQKNTRAGLQRVAHIVSHCILVCWPLVEQECLLHSCVLLCLLGVFSDFQRLIGSFNNVWFLPMVARILAGQTHVDQSLSVGELPVHLQSLARQNAAAVLGSVVSQESGSVGVDIPLHDVLLGLLGGLLDRSDTTVHNHTTLLVEPFLKCLKKGQALRTDFQLLSATTSGFLRVLDPANALTTSSVVEPMTQIVAALVKKKRPPAESLGQLLTHDDSVTQLFLAMVLFSAIPRLALELSHILQSASVACLTSTLIPFWRHCLVSTEDVWPESVCCGFPYVVEGLQSMDLSNETVEDLWSQVIVPYVSQDAPPTERKTRLFSLLVRLIMKKDQKLQERSVQLTQLLWYINTWSVELDHVKHSLHQVLLESLTLQCVSSLLTEKTCWDPTRRHHVSAVGLLASVVAHCTLQKNLHDDDHVHVAPSVLPILTFSVSWFRVSLTMQSLEPWHATALDNLIRCLTPLMAYGEPQDFDAMLEHTLTLLSLSHYVLNKLFDMESDSLNAPTELCVDLILFTQSVMNIWMCSDPHTSYVEKCLRSLCDHVVVVLVSKAPRVVHSAAFRCNLRNLFISCLRAPFSKSMLYVLIPVYTLTQVLFRHHVVVCAQTESNATCSDETLQLCSNLLAVAEIILHHTFCSVQKGVLLASFFFALMHLWEVDVPVFVSRSKRTHVGSLDWIQDLCTLFLDGLKGCKMNVVLQCVYLVCGEPTTQATPGHLDVLSHLFPLPPHSNVYVNILRWTAKSIARLDKHTFTFILRLPKEQLASLCPLLLEPPQTFYNHHIDEDIFTAAVRDASDAHTEDQLSKTVRFAVHWLASCILSVVSVSKKQKCPLATPELLKVSSSIANDLVAQLNSPVVVLLLIVFITNNSHASTQSPFPTPFTATLRTRHMKACVRFCRLVWNQCFTHLLTQRYDQVPEAFHTMQNDLPLLTARERTQTVNATGLIDKAVQGLITTAKLVTNEPSIVWQVLGSFTLTFGSVCPSVFVPRLAPLLLQQLTPPHYTATVEKWNPLGSSGILNVVCYSLLRTVPKQLFLVHFNALMENIFSVWNHVMEPVQIDNPAKDIGLEAYHLLQLLGIILLSPSRCYLTPHLTTLTQTILLDPRLLQFILLQEASSRTYMRTFYHLFSYVRTPPPTCAWFDHLYETLTKPLRLSCPVSLFQLWSFLSTRIVDDSLNTHVIDALVTYMKECTQRIATMRCSWIDAASCGVALNCLAAGVTTLSCDAVAVKHHELATVLMSAICAAVDSLTVILKDPAAYPLAVFQCIQSGFEDAFTSSLTSTLFSNPTCIRPYASIDLSVPHHFQYRYFAILESAIVHFVSAWLPKMTNAQLLPLLTTLATYASHGKPVFMFNACPEDFNGNFNRIEQHESRPHQDDEWVVSRDAASARLFFNVYTTIASNMGEIGVLSSVWDVVPHLKETLIQCQRKAFEIAMTEGDRAMATNHEKRRRLNSSGRQDTITVSWWWFDLGVSALLCLASLAKEIRSTSFVDLFLPIVINGVDLFAILLRPKLSFSTTMISFDDADECRQTLSHTWLKCTMHAAQHLMEHILSDTIRVRSNLNPLLQKIQSSQSSAVRYAAQALLAHFWVSYGIGFVVSLEDSLHVFIELLDDSDQDVERLTKQLIQHIEHLTGETVKSRLGM